jgi:hypothetical protein
MYYMSQSILGFIFANIISTSPEDNPCWLGIHSHPLLKWLMYLHMLLESYVNSLFMDYDKVKLSWLIFEPERQFVVT